MSGPHCGNGHSGLIFYCVSTAPFTAYGFSVASFVNCFIDGETEAWSCKDTSFAFSLGLPAFKVQDLILGIMPLSYEHEFRSF